MRFTRLWQRRPPPPGTGGGYDTPMPPTPDSPTTCEDRGGHTSRGGGRATNEVSWGLVWHSNAATESGWAVVDGDGPRGP